MDLVVCSVAFVAFLAAGLGYEWWSKPRNRARRSLRRARNVPIAEVEDGQPAKLTGVVRGPHITSPLGEQTCIGYSLLIGALVGWTHPVAILRKESWGAFSIEDETGKVDVDGPFLIDLDARDDWSVVPPHRRDELEQELSRHGMDATKLFRALAVFPFPFRGRFAFREALLRPGDRVSVLGLVSFEPDPTAPPAGLRTPAISAHLRGSKDQPVIVAGARDRRPPPSAARSVTTVRASGTVP